ncbi:hypothetical protein ScPMuIL_004174 [Solemya velum]
MIVFLIVALWGGVVESTPHPCCTPLQYEAYVSINGGYANVDGGNANPQEGTYMLYFDFSNRRTTLLSRMKINGSYQRARVVNFYQQRRSYIITPDGICSSHPMTASDNILNACIPADATLLAETDYGSPSSSIATTSWGTTIGNFAYRITVTKEGCSPVYYGFYGTTETNVTVAQTHFYTNVRAGISDLSVFELPTNCSSTS